jgi:hypothetical protein
MKIREFSLSTWFTGVVVALLPALAFGHDGKNQSVENRAAAASTSAEEADIAQSKAQFEHAERTLATTRQTGLPADAQQGINPAEVEKTFGKQVSVVDLSSLTPDQSRALQQTLADRGYYHGKVDGVIGTETRAAVTKLLARQFALNQRLVRQGRVTEPFLSALGVQANELAPVSGTDAKHVRPQAISPTAAEHAPAKHGAKKPRKNDEASRPDTSKATGSKGAAGSRTNESTDTNGASHGAESIGTGGTGADSGSRPRSSSRADPLSGYWDQQG